MLQWSPFDSPLERLAEASLANLIAREVPEGLFVEYKGAWAADKVTRSVASFANTHGGTLVIGMEARGLLPTNLVGLAAQDEPEARVVNAVRSAVASVPSFDVKAVPLRSGYLRTFAYKAFEFIDGASSTHSQRVAGQ